MELNAYQPCPCHAEQKIKFCCGKQIVDDLNQVMALARGHQTLATLDKLDRLIAERGPKDCLLTLKTHFLITLMEIDKARQCNEQFLQTNPKHPIGMQHRAMIFLAEHKLGEAMNALQDAMDGIKGTAVPVSLGNAFRLVGLELLRHGDPIAARRHLAFARSLNNADEQAAMLIVESYRIPGRSLLLKQDFELPNAPPDLAWSKTYHQLRRVASRGQWRTALQYLELKLLPQFPEVAALHKARAILALWLSQDEKARDAWSHYAQLPGVFEDEAIDAQMWVDLLSDGHSTNVYDIVQYTAPIGDMEKLLARLSSNNRFVAMETDVFEAEDGPPPKASFVLLDRPALSNSDSLEMERIPNVLTEFLVFGRQTDREARVEFDVICDGTEQDLLRDLENVLSGAIDLSKSQTEPMGKISEKQLRLASRWHLPPAVDRTRLAELEHQNEQRLLLEVWPEIAVPALDNQSPSAVCGNPAYRIKLQALIGELEMMDQLHEIDRGTIDRLREKLGLPAYESVDPERFVHATPTPLQRMRVAWKNASDDLLMANFYYAMSAGYWKTLRDTAMELMRRPHLETKVPIENVCTVLANITKDDNESLNYIRQARKAAHAKGQPIGLWLVAELELRVKRNISEKTAELFQEIRARHMNEPNVAARMRRLLAALGPDETTSRLDESEAELAPAGGREESGALWTPQSTGTAAGSGKLWLPGSE
jgi:hypothetical protein